MPYKINNGNQAAKEPGIPNDWHQIGTTGVKGIRNQSPYAAGWRWCQRMTVLRCKAETKEWSNYTRITHDTGDSLQQASPESRQ
jgi:hypothetical protein